MDFKHEVIFCIVNEGFSDEVMESAREFGAKGGTVIHARGTANPDAEKIFNIPISPEKEIVMIVVESKIKNDILHSLYNKVGLNTAGKGIAFSMPISEVVGLSTAKLKEKVDEKTTDKSEETDKTKKD